MPSPAKWRRARQRIVDAFYEIGVLLIAFAPLDYTVDPRPLRTTWQAMVSFVSLGFAFIALSIYSEWIQEPPANS
jgi:hypothetical protein